MPQDLVVVDAPKFKNIYRLGYKTLNLTINL
jgi:hypothetical protein